MANTLLPIEERNLTPDQVELLDKRRRRGQLFLVLCFQTLIVGTLVTLWAGQDWTLSPGWTQTDGVLGRDHVYAFADIRRCGCAAETWEQRVHQLLADWATRMVQRRVACGATLLLIPSLRVVKDI